MWLDEPYECPSLSCICPESCGASDKAGSVRNWTRPTRRVKSLLAHVSLHRLTTQPSGSIQDMCDGFWKMHNLRLMGGKQTCAKVFLSGGRCIAIPY
ncbi:hypothetical protein UPYG_G00078470 [Umbra pygmaea]|uniref:Uncharacterized protein n=1 Tax=Umbra pygmaea TaxID=75934 RepID=A0ABD0XD80_UMBPY